MDTKLYLTIAAIVAILFGLGFLLIPANVIPLYGVPLSPHVITNARFFGSALLAWGVITWFARDFQEWAAVRGVLIGSVVGDIVGGLVNIWGTMRGLDERARVVVDDHLRAAAARGYLLSVYRFAQDGVSAFATTGPRPIGRKRPSF